MFPLKKSVFWRAIALGALAGSLWLFFHPLIPVSVSPDEPLIPAANAQGEVGFINSRGQEILPFQWSFTDGFDSDGLAPVGKSGHFGWIDRKGTVMIPLEYDIPWIEFSHPILAYQGCDSKGWIMVSRDGKCGWIDRAGKEMLPFIWDGANHFDEKGLAMVSKDGKNGWINREGKIMVPLEWDEAVDFDSQGMVPAKKEGKWGWINQEGKLVLPLEWDDVKRSGFDSEGMALVSKNEKWGAINREGKVILPAEWDSIENFDSGGLARVMKDHKWGAINREGKVVIAMEWGHIVNFDSEGMAIVMKDKKYGAINREGKVIIPVEWRDLNSFDTHGMARVSNDEWKVGWINRRGERVIACRFTRAAALDSFDQAWAIEDGALGRINRKGDQAEGWVFHLGLSMDDYNSSSLMTTNDRNGNTGCLDRNGQWIIPLGRWKRVEYYDVTSSDAGARRFRGVFATMEEDSRWVKGWRWLAGKLSLPKSFTPSIDGTLFYNVYDEQAGRVIWSSRDRKREIWWGIGLVAMAAGALFMVRRCGRNQNGRQSRPR